MKKLLYLIPIMMVIILSACGYKAYGDYTYGDFEHINDWDETESLGEDDYEFLYVYDRDFKGTSNLGSDVVNETLFKFAKETNHGKEFTFINTREMTGTHPPHIPSRAPRLYIIKDQSVVDVYPSAQEIFEFIELFENGNYTPDDWYSYDDFNNLENWAHFSNVGQNDYGFFYVYDKPSQEASCAGCEAVNKELFPFAKLGEHSIETTTANISDIAGEKPSNMLETVPALYIVKNSQVLETYSGEEDILKFIDAFENGEYILPEAPEE